MPSDALLQLIGDTHSLLDLDEFRVELLAALGRAVPAEWVSLNDIGPAPGDFHIIARPSLSEAIRLFASLAHENPLIERYRQTGDGRAYRFSDVVSPDQLRATAVYREFYAPLGVEHQIAFSLPARPPSGCSASRSAAASGTTATPNATSSTGHSRS